METAILSLACGFGVSFLVMDVSRIAGSGAWPVANSVARRNFQPFAIFLAVFAGPALFAQAMIGIWAQRAMSLRDAVAAAFIACVWAWCYGLLVVRSASALALALVHP